MCTVLAGNSRGQTRDSRGQTSRGQTTDSRGEKQTVEDRQQTVDTKVLSKYLVQY